MLFPFAFAHQETERSINNNSIRNIYFYPDGIAINSLELADGIKELLNNYEFTLNEY